MKKFTCTILIGFTAFTLSHGADVPATGDAEGKAPATETPTIELKNKSSFVMDESGRNPFWPIGWKPAPKSNSAPTSEHSGPEISPNSFLVSSIVLDPGAPRFAIVNGKTMQEGQVFGLQIGNQTYQITVKAIEDGRVVLARRDQEIFVPLRRR
jgi:hypothetical protein